MGRNFAHSVKAITATSLTLAAMLGAAEAQSQFQWSPTNPTYFQLPETGLAGGPCDPAVDAAMNSAGNYSVNKQFTVTQGFMRTPGSFLSCLQPFFQSPGTNNGLNTFNSNGGLSIGSLLTGILQAMVGSLLQNISNQVCANVQQITGYVQTSGSYGVTNTATGGPSTAISGASPGTSVSNMIGQAPGVVDPVQAQAQTGSMVMAQDTMGQSIAAVNSPVTADPPAPPTQMSLADADFDNPAPNTNPPPPPPAPHNPSLPASVPTNPSPAIGNPGSGGSGTGGGGSGGGGSGGTTNAYGGTIIKNYQNVQLGRYYGKDENCVQMVRAPSPPSLGNLPPVTGWRGGQIVQGTMDLAPGVVIATFLGPGGSFNAPQHPAGVYHQHGCVYLSQNGNGVMVLQQYTGSGGAQHKLLRWTSGSKDDMYGEYYHVVIP